MQPYRGWARASPALILNQENNQSQSKEHRYVSPGKPCRDVTGTASSQHYLTVDWAASTPQLRELTRSEPRHNEQALSTAIGARSAKHNSYILECLGMYSMQKARATSQRDDKHRRRVLVSPLPPWHTSPAFLKKQFITKKICSNKSMMSFRVFCVYFFYLSNYWTKRIEILRNE